MEVLLSVIQKGSTRCATKSVKIMIEDLQERRSYKNVKIVDKTPAGWDTVQAYLSDDLASHSEDDKTLKAAEARALRKQKQKKIKKKQSKK